MNRLVSDEAKGQGMVEYALIILLIALIVVASLVAVGPAVGGVFSGVTPAL